MKKTINRVTNVTVLLIMLTFFSCNVLNIDDRPDPNNTELVTVQENPTRAEVNTLITGTESSLRTDLRIYHINLGMIGREMYRFLASEPRNTQDLLGGGTSELDAGSFYTTRPWAAFYASIRNANILIESVKTVSDPNVLSDAEKNGIFGVANTFKAYEYLLALNMQNENGLRQQNEADPQQTGEFLTKQQSFDLISSLLDEAADNLANAGDAFQFSLSSGFEGFDTPATFLQFNRALRARVAVYTGDFTGALTYVDDSFIDEGGDLTTGTYHIYSTDTNDQTNPVYANPQSGAGDSWLAHPSFVSDAEPNDNRVLGNKAIQRVDADGDPNPATLDGLTSNYGLFVYKSQTAPFPIIRNAELILIKAEALIQRNQGTDLDDAEDLLNIIRNNAGLADYSGATTQADLIDEMLNQRRYELFFEGHRWVDMRRYNRLDELPLDRAGDNVWGSFPIPQPENVGS